MKNTLLEKKTVIAVCFVKNDGVFAYQNYNITLLARGVNSEFCFLPAKRKQFLEAKKSFFKN